MYVALKEIKVAHEGKNLIIPPGNHIPGTDKWTVQSLRANVSLGNLRWEGEGNPPHEIDYDVHRRAAAAKAKAAEKEVEPSISLRCDECGIDFKKPAGLKSHVRAKHAKSA